MAFECQICGNRVCNCPPNQQVGCVVPCVDSILTFPLNQTGCDDVRTNDLTSVSIIVFLIVEDNCIS